jgi:predicted DNA-binding protein
MKIKNLEKLSFAKALLNELTESQQTIASGKEFQILTVLTTKKFNRVFSLAG